MRSREMRFALRLGLCVFAAVSSAACSGQSSTPADATLTESSYTNRYFGFTLTPPTGWAVASEETKKAMMDRGAGALSEGSEARRGALEETLKDTYQLLTITEHPFGSPVESNPAFQVLAEKVSQAPGVRTGKDYLFQVEKLITGTSLGYTVKEPVRAQTLGGREVFRIEFEVKMGARTVHQVYMSTVDKGYALSFIQSYTQPEESTKLSEIVDSIHFD